MKAIDYANAKYGRHSLSIAQAGLKKYGLAKDNIILKLIQPLLDYCLLLESRISMFQYFLKIDLILQYLNALIFLKIINLKINKQNMEI